MVVTLSQQNQLWNRILSNIKERVEDKHIYDSFFANTKLHKVEGDIMYICVDSKLSIKLGKFHLYKLYSRFNQRSY